MKLPRKLIALLLAVCLLSAAVVGAHPFRDVPGGSWYDSAVEYVYEYGLMDGISGDSFGPALTMNRAMVVTVLYRMAGSPEVSTTAPFTDVKAGTFYEKPVAWAYENGIVMGVSATEFAPGANVLRCQLVTFFYRYADAMGVDTSARADLRGYLDSGEVMAFAADAFSWAVAVGIVSGMSADTLGPNGTANRAQCAVIIQRLGQLMGLTPPEKVELTLDRTEAQILVGGTLTLHAAYNGSKTLTWKSTALSVAKVDNGVVTARGKGVAYIQVTDGELTATCRLTVNDQPGTIRISAPEDKIYAGETYQFTATVEGNDAPTLTWSCSDNATIDENGLLTALTAGPAWVRATDGNTVAECGFRIYEPEIKAEEIKIMNTDGPFYDGVTRYKGDYVSILASNRPYDANRVVFAKSSNTDVISVSMNGVTGGDQSITLNFKSAGTAKITLTSGDGAVSQSYTITVKDDYDFNPGNRQLTPEEFADYTTKVMCANGFTYDSGCTSWRQLTLTKDKLNFVNATSAGQALVHDWWPNGKRYCQIVYVEQDDNGNYVFHTCWG